MMPHLSLCLLWPVKGLLQKSSRAGCPDHALLSRDGVMVTLPRGNASRKFGEEEKQSLRLELIKSTPHHLISNQQSAYTGASA